jgi:hypothetical protein
MSIKDKFFAAVAALMIVGGLGAAAAPTVSAATPSCGKNCINLFAQLYGSSYVLDVLLNQGQNADQPNVGQPLILAPASNSNPGEDFVASEQGTVSDFILAGLVSPDLSAYDNDEAFEFEYAPFGAETGLCMGWAIPRPTTRPSAFNRVASAPRRCGFSISQLPISHSPALT